MGTHAIVKTAVGSKFVATASMDLYEAERQKEMGNSFSFSAEASGFGYSASASGSHDVHKKSHNTKMESFSTAKTYTIGSDLPGGANVAEKLTNWVARKDEVAKDP